MRFKFLQRINLIVSHGVKVYQNRTFSDLSNEWSPHTNNERLNSHKALVQLKSNSLHVLKVTNIHPQNSCIQKYVYEKFLKWFCFPCLFTFLFIKKSLMILYWNTITSFQWHLVQKRNSNLVGTVYVKITIF